jgi:hypothetical protein
MARKNDLRERRIAQIRVALNSKPFEPVSPQVAQNLGRMLDEAENQGHRKSAIVAAGLNKRDDPNVLKQLDRLTAPSPCPDSRALRLDKKPTNYRRVAEAWGRALGRDDGETLFRLFGDSDFGRKRPVSDTDELEPWSLLAQGLRDCAEHVIRLEDMTTYWRRARETSGVYDPRANTIRPARQSLVISSAGMAFFSGCSDEVEPMPSVRLARRLQSEPVSGMVWLDPKGVEADKVIPDPAPQTWPPVGLVHAPALYRLWLDIRLGVGPPSSSDHIAPLLELRTNLEIDIDGCIGYPDNPFTDGSDTVNYIRLGSFFHRIVLESPIELPCSFGSPSFHMAEHSYFAWAQVSAESLREVLDDSLSLLNGATAFETENRPLHEKSLLPVHLNGLECRVRNGELEAALIDEARHFKTMLAHHRRDLRQAFEADLEAARLRQADRENEIILSELTINDN